MVKTDVNDREVDLDFSINNSKNKNSKSNVIHEFKVQKLFLFFYILTLAINGICVAWTTGGNN